MKVKLGEALMEVQNIFSWRERVRYMSDGMSGEFQDESPIHYKNFLAFPEKYLTDEHPTIRKVATALIAGYENGSIVKRTHDT